MQMCFLLFGELNVGGKMQQIEQYVFTNLFGVIVMVSK